MSSYRMKLIEVARTRNALHPAGTQTMIYRFSIDDGARFIISTANRTPRRGNLSTIYRCSPGIYRRTEHLDPGIIRFRRLLPGGGILQHASARPE